MVLSKNNAWHYTFIIPYDKSTHKAPIFVGIIFFIINFQKWYVGGSLSLSIIHFKSFKICQILTKITVAKRGLLKLNGEKCGRLIKTYFQHNYTTLLITASLRGNSLKMVIGIQTREIKSTYMSQWYVQPKSHDQTTCSTSYFDGSLLVPCVIVPQYEHPIQTSFQSICIGKLSQHLQGDFPN